MAKFMLGKSVEVAAWAAKQLPWAQEPDSFGPCEAWGIIKDEQMVGAVIFNHHHPEIGDIEWNIVAPNTTWVGRDTLEVVFDYVFNQLKCVRMSVTLPKGAKKNREFLEKLGFIMEGTKRRGFPGGQNAILYGLLKEECKWLKADPRKVAA